MTEYDTGPIAELVREGRYRHSKTNRMYQVLGTALSTEDNTQLVIYRPLYESDQKLYARPLSMFTEFVTLGAERVPRFVYLGD